MGSAGAYQLLDSLPDALLVASAEGNILGLNRAASVFLKRSAEEVIGRPLTELTETPQASVAEFLRLCSRTKQRLLGAMIFQKDGSAVHCRVEGFLARPKDGGAPAEILLRVQPKETTTGRFIALNERIDQLSREIARRHRAEQALRRERELLEVTLASIGDAVIATDERGAVTFLNGVAQSLTGWSSAEAEGQPLDRVFHIVNEQTGGTVESPVMKVLREGQVVGLANHTVLVSKDRRERPIDDSGAPIRDMNGALLGVVLVFRDVSERKRIEEERESLLTSEREARSEAERASRMKDEFLATLSHELRTPLNAVLGYATLLQMKRPNETELQESMEAISRNARLQAQLIEDLLDMNRIISGKIRLEVEMVDLPAVIAAALKTVEPSADAKGLRITKVVDPAAGAVRGDPSRLQQVIWNLLSNAVKFTPKGGKIQIALARVDSHVEITVSDNGQGISPEFLPYVFDRFRQADSTITRHFGGLGLGLSIVKQLVELHGGQVQVKSAGEGKGATFIVNLPSAALYPQLELDEKVAAANQAACDVAALPNLSGVRILVVDDELDACSLVMRVLEGRNGEVDMATSAADALEKIQAKQYHVLISDIGMPGKDGYQLIRDVRALGNEHGGGNIPAIALTAFARSEDRQRAALAGFNNYLSKPVEVMELLAVVANMAGRTGG